MNSSKQQFALQADLEDILGSLQFARRSEDLGRLALLTYWEVRRWARATRHELLAEHASKVITDHPHPTRLDFLQLVDSVIAELENIRAQVH